MEKLVAFTRDCLAASWTVFVESAPYMLFGFFIAGLLYVFLKPEKVVRYFGGRGMRPVVLSALAGVPIPLCSCGVIPAAAGLKKQGASRSATVSFLISTPETGMDSIPITYALIDPLMAIARPVAAFFTAVVAGVAESLFGRPETSGQTVAPTTDGAMPATNMPPLATRLKAGLHYSFGELLGDIGPWFLIGVVLAGLIITLVPDNLISGYLGNPLLAMLAMLAAGIPMYVCATSSTPIAAALILKGLNPGAALVFLLAGPATNVATLSMVSGLLGKRSTAIYLASIIACAFAMGLLVDFLYATLQLQPTAIAGQAAELLPDWFKTGAAVLLIGLLATSFRHTHRAEIETGCGCSAGCSSTK